MLLAAAILSSIGGLAILAGAWIQINEASSLYSKHEAVRDIEVWVDQTLKTPDPQDAAPQRGNYVTVATCTGWHFHKGEGDDAFTLSKWPTPRTFFKEHSFAGWYGWNLIFLGGALVLAGSLISAIAAA